MLRTLRELKIDGNPLVILTSDNGPWLAQNGNGGHADPLRDGNSRATKAASACHA